MNNFLLNSVRTMIYLITCSILFISCSTTDSTKDTYKFAGFSEITEGETATLSWNLPNTKYVKIEGIDGVFGANDSVTVAPKKSTKYLFNIQEENFKKAKSWVVYVKNNSRQKKKFAFQNRAEKSKTIKELTNESKPEKTTPISEETRITFHAVEVKPKVDNAEGESKEYGQFAPSYLESKYFKGILEKKDLQNPRQIKVMRTEFTDYKKDTLKIQALILDEFGNFLPSLPKEVLEGSVSIVHHCTMGMFTDKVTSYRESEHFDLSPYVDLAICVDNSAAAEQNRELIKVIQETLPELPDDNRIMMSYYNHGYERLFALQNLGTRNIKFNINAIPKPSGLNSSYMAMDKALNDLNSIVSPNKKALIMVIYGTDNSSILFNFNDLVNTANRHKIPIYTIAVGTGINSFALKYISSVSGGKYYELTNENVDQLKDIIKEVTFAQKGYYEFKIPLNSLNEEECRKQRSELIFDTGINTVSDIVRLFRVETKMPKLPKSLTAFDRKGTDIDTLYIKNIDKITKILFDNPEYKVELIGHSGIEGSDKDNNDLATRRAQKVRNYMLEKGVDSEQISTRSAGSNKPLYFMQQTDWQELYNRRVEIKWMNPEDKPFEIVCGKADNEEDALSYVDKWEGMGYNCYYERYLNKNIPVYIVKLWGYSTLEQAEEIADILKNKFKSDFFVE